MILRFFNRFISFKSSEYSGLYTDKHLKGLYGNIGVQMSDNSLSPEIVGDISNLGFVSSNGNSRNVKDNDKNSFNPRFVLENPSLKVITDWSLEISILIPTISNKFGNLKLIIQGKTKKIQPTFPFNQFAIQGYLKPHRFDINRNGGGVFIYVGEDIPDRELKTHNTPEDIYTIFYQN